MCEFMFFEYFCDCKRIFVPLLQPFVVEAVNAEANEFLKRIACVNLCSLSIFAIANGFSFLCSSHLSLKLFGDKTPRTTPLAKNEISQLLKCLRMARRAGVQRTASPIGEGSQTRISSFVVCDFWRGICDSGFALHIAIFARALCRMLMT